ncbi:receptor-type guanylate cyclase Gyc76C-like [Anthonomus grandis grandis]|uniref:receptor-type guanylate cyclase Gyc76C-like n=1 Tax=Anthonomus grandis grandis TaxID=2921223 RepID=UPI002164FC03|nr:receptor-type guanylate cyclase Gyc76C-like [Anthonomus grandis grandis]
MRLGQASLLVTLLLCLSRIPSNAESVLPPVNVDDDWSRPPPITAPTPYYAGHLNGTDYHDLYNLMEDEEEDNRFSPSAGGFKRENLTVGDLKKESLDDHKVKLVLGYLTAVKGVLKERQGLMISGAISMAIKEINQDESILPNVTLVLRWNDTRGDTVVATRAMTDMICEGVAAFFGPEGACYVEAIVSQARNIPMISYKCSDYKASDVPTFARTEPPDTQVTKSIFSLLTYYNWHKFSIIYEERWDTVALSLEKQAAALNMSVQHKKNARDRHRCCEQNYKCCHTGFWYDFIQNSKNKTRIYVFLGTPYSLIDFMDNMQRAQLFENGEYIVIYADMNTYLKKESHRYIFKFDEIEKYKSCKEFTDYQNWRKRAKSLFVVVPTAPSDNYKKFSEDVRQHNELDPFDFHTFQLFVNYMPEFVSIYAAYLYDSVKLYASALHYLLAQETVLNENVIREIASNGTKIIETIIKINQTYRSVTGAVIKLDKNGDSEGNFSVLAYKESEQVSFPGPKYNFSCPFLIGPVGQFYQSDDVDLPQYKINPNTKILWAGGDKPSDEPSCGFDNELCQKTDTHRNSIIAAGLLAITLFCASVVTMSIYRKWKIEQEIEGLLWKIDREDIHNYLERDLVSSPSRLSLCSASVTSYESRGGLQVFTTTATYKGVVVRIKELTFSRKKDISREVMKEMRLLRDLRHDNVNSFIGACVQPTSLLLVTDYCAKGSLYDIIENEDIKLDKMFVASLVHDLIKGMLYLHNSLLGCHGNLKSSNCVVTSRWVLQVTDFGLIDLRHYATQDYSEEEHQIYRNLLWKAPELLRYPDMYPRGSQKGDVYAFALILYEILGRRGPFGPVHNEPKDIVLSIKEPKEGQPLVRPDVDLLYDSEVGCDGYVLEVMQECWAENPDHRPDFATIRTKLKGMKEGKSKNIMDQMMDMMVTYANNLEELVNERTRLLYEEKNKTEDLLHRMLPKPVAARLTKGYGIEPESFDQVTIYFSDIVGFTAMSAESTPLQVVDFLNDLYTVFDRIIKGYDVYKVETIGDAYMVVSGLPIRNGDNHAGHIASMALDLLAAVKKHSVRHRPNETLKLRIGIHTGPVVAGVVGLTMPRYCLFGDTVNTASRMESNGEPLKIHISMQCKEALEKLGGYVIEGRGIVNMKGKGAVETFWLVGANDAAIKPVEVDYNDLPPLFCGPRRSPKLNNESRQPSIVGGHGGLHSRRHSSVPREPHGTYGGSRSTINTAFGSQLIDAPEEGRYKPRPRRVLSSIASSSDEPHKSWGVLNKIRESKSLDPLPAANAATTGRTSKSPLDLIDSFLKGRKRSAQSLIEDWDNQKEIQIIAIPKDKMVNNNFPNGNLLSMTREEQLGFIEDAQVPLLKPPLVVRHRGGSDFLGSDCSKPKLTHSLDALPTKEYNLVQKNSFKKFLAGVAGIFNGNSVKSSHASLRKGVLNEYNNIQQPDSESMV